MRLSEALRLGEFSLPACYATWFRWEKDKLCAGCAVARACFAAGYRHQYWTSPEKEFLPLSQFFVTTWPWILAYEMPIVGTHYVPQLLLDISNLYEVHRWPMAKIADWVEQIEREMETTPAKDAHQPAHALA